MRSARTMFFGSLVVMAVLFGIGANRYAALDEVVVSRAATQEKIVAVTIDDGPHDKATPRMLEALRDTGIKATFFILGKSAEEYPDLVRQVIADGHEIATHGYSHRNMARMSRAECEEEWEKAEHVLAEFGVQTDLFRPPGGAYGEVLVEGAKERGYHIILWDVDPRDWQVPSDDTIVERIMAEVRPGSIILLHDGQYPIHSADALRKVADRLKADGYSFVTVSEMMGMSAGGAE